MPPKQRKKQNNVSASSQCRGRLGSAFSSCPWCQTSVASALLRWHLIDCTSYLLQHKPLGEQKSGPEITEMTEDGEEKAGVFAAGQEPQVVCLDELSSPWSPQDDAVRVSPDSARVLHESVRVSPDSVRILSDSGRTWVIKEKEVGLRDDDDGDDAMTHSQREDDTVLDTPTIDDEATASQKISDLVRVLQKEEDVVTIPQNKGDFKGISQMTVDTIQVSHHTGHEFAVLQNKDDPCRTSQAISVAAALLSENTGEEIMVSENKPISISSSQKVDLTGMLLPCMDNAIREFQHKETGIVLQNEEDAVKVVQNQDKLSLSWQVKGDVVDVCGNNYVGIGIVRNKEEASMVSLIRDDDTLGALERDKYHIRACHSSSDSAEVRQEAEAQQCKQSLAITGFSNSTLVERTHSNNGVKNQDFVSLCDGLEAEGMSYSNLKAAYFMLESKHNALICLHEETEKKYQGLLSREQESQSKLSLLWHRHENALKLLESMKERLDCLSAQSSLPKEKDSSASLLDEYLIGLGSTLLKTDGCSSTIMKNAEDVMDGLREARSGEAVSPSNLQALPVDSMAVARQIGNPPQFMSCNLTDLESRVGIVENMMNGDSVELRDAQFETGGTSSSVKELAKIKCANSSGTCSDRKSIAESHSLLTRHASTPEMILTSLAPITPGRLPGHATVVEKISTTYLGPAAPGQSIAEIHEVGIEAMNTATKNLEPYTPEKAVSSVPGSSQVDNFDTNPTSSLTKKNDFSCSVFKETEQHASETPAANSWEITGVPSTEAPVYLQRTKKLHLQNPKAECMHESLLPRLVGTSCSLGSSAEEVSLSLNELHNLNSQARKNLHSFGTTRKSKGRLAFLSSRRHIIAESSDSEGEIQHRDVTKKESVSSLRPQNRVSPGRFDLQNENMLTGSRGRIIAISSDSESGDKVEVQPNDPSYHELVTSDEVSSKMPALKRLKKVGLDSTLEVNKDQKVEEEDAVGDELASSMLDGVDRLDSVKHRAARTCQYRIVEDHADQAGNSPDHEQSCEVLDKTKIRDTSGSDAPQLRRFGKRRLTYSGVLASEDSSMDETRTHRGTTQRHESNEKGKAKKYANLSKESSESESEDEIEEDSEGDSLGGFIVDDIDESEDCINSNMLSESCQSDASGTNSSGSTDELQSNSCSSGSSQNGKFVWDYEAQLLAALGRSDELCLHALCALYRQQTPSEQKEKCSSECNKRGFDKFHALKASDVAEFLIDGDCTRQLKKNVLDLKCRMPQGVEFCRDMAFRHSKQLFEIYRNGEDPYFCKRK